MTRSKKKVKKIKEGRGLKKLSLFMSYGIKLLKLFEKLYNSIRFEKQREGTVSIQSTIPA